MGELRSGWRFIAACAAGVMCSSIVLPYYSIGTLVDPVTTEFGWTRAEFQTAILFSSGLGALTAPVVGWLNDRFGYRRVAIPGLIGLAFGFALASTLDGGLWLLYLAYACMAILGAGTIPVTWTQAVTHHFFTNRGLALGLTLTGTGICGILVPHYTLWLLDDFGWRGAYLGLAIIPIIFALPLVVLWMRPFQPAEPPPEVLAPQTGLTFSQAVRTFRFWLLLLTIFLAYMGLSGIGANLFPSLTDDGLPAGQAATVVSMFGAAVIVGRLVVGALVDRYWAPAVAFGALMLPAFGAWLFIGPQDFITACVAAFLIGFAAGAELDLMSFLAARYFGLAHYGQIYSVLYATLAVCSGTAPMLFAQIYDTTQSYDTAYMVLIGLFIASAVLIPLMGRYPEHFNQEATSQ